MFSTLYLWLLANKEVVALVCGVIALSYPKLPHPDKYAGTHWFFPYLVLHSVLARISVLEWNKVGGAVKLPGTLSPSLEAARSSETLGNLARSLEAVQADMSQLQHVAHLAEPLEEIESLGSKTVKLTPSSTHKLAESMKVEK